MRKKSSNSVPTHLLSIVSGFFLGISLFRAPSWACGVLRSDLAPLWAAAGAGFLAAAATVWAVVVALRGGKQAIEAERALRDEENRLVLVERKRQARCVASAFFSCIHGVALSVEGWRLLIMDKKMPTKDLMQMVANFPMHTLNTFVSRVELFDEEDARRLGRVYGHMSDAVEQARDNICKVDTWDARMATKQRGLFKDLIDSMVDPSIDAYESIKSLFDETWMIDPREAGREYYKDTIQELKNSGKI